MIDHTDQPCHWDHTLRERVTRDHAEDCPSHHDSGHGCPGDHGCQPCPRDHCVLCGREHTTLAEPLTCPTCVSLVDEDLTTITLRYDELADEATDAAGDGRLAAAAPIPGSTATILRGPTVLAGQVRTAPGVGHDELAKAHHVNDPIPPYAVLGAWEDRYRAWWRHPRPTAATVPASVAYLRRHLDDFAQDTRPGGPDWLTFTRHVRLLRTRLEYAIHDEQVPELGVDCFECGEQLVRRFRDKPVKVCRHRTPARRRLQRVMLERRRAQEWLVVLAEAGRRPSPAEAAAARRLPSRELVAETKVPCGACADQGGLEDPRAGRGWECPGCRKQYDPGEYALAIRRGLLDQGPNADGWTHLSMATEAAHTLTGVQIPAATVRKWMDRAKVTSCCLVRYTRDEDGQPRVRRWGARLVYWPDVADEALAFVDRAREAEARRRQAAAARAACVAEHGPECWDRGRCTTRRTA